MFVCRESMVQHCVSNLVKEHSSYCLNSVGISAQSTRSPDTHEEQNIFGRVHAQSTEVRLNPCLVSQSVQFAKVTLKTQYIQTKP